MFYLSMCRLGLYGNALWSGVSGAILSLHGAVAAPSCDTATNIPNDLTTVAAGLIGESEFDETFGGGGRIYLKLANTVPHFTPTTVRIFTAPGTPRDLLCESHFGIGPYTTTLLKYVMLGDSVKYRVIVSTGPVDASGISLIVLSDPKERPWEISLSNIDDLLFVTLNGARILECRYRQNCVKDFGSLMKPGSNSLRLSVHNTGGPWTYGYLIKKDGKIVSSGRCGDNSRSPSVGCNSDTRTGEVYTQTFNLVK